MLLAVSISLSGCFAALGAGTVVASKKTPIDHVVSLFTGKDCSIVRKNRGDTYCVEDEVAAPVSVYCYPTLGEATCYASPDPYPGGQRRLGSIAGVAAGG